MREKIAVEAERSGRSMNAEIVQRLETSFQDLEHQLVANRQLELIQIYAEIERATYKLGRATSGTEDFSALQRYLERLELYLGLVANGIEAIRSARHPRDGGSPAEVHEFPHRGKSTAR